MCRPFLTARWLYGRLKNWGRRDARFIVLFGPPGSGKGTQAVRLAERLAVPHVSSGDLIRRHMIEGTQFGKECAPYVAAGQLVPDRLLMPVVEREYTGERFDSGVVSDGYPRTWVQGESLDWALASVGNQVDLVVYLDVAEEDLLIRLGGRRVCSNKMCKGTYHTHFAPPRKPEICDLCGAALTTRKDDDPKVIQERLQIFRGTAPGLEEYYSQTGRLVKVSADNSVTPDEVHARVLAAVGG